MASDEEHSTTSSINYNYNKLKNKQNNHLHHQRWTEKPNSDINQNYYFPTKSKNKLAKNSLKEQSINCKNEDENDINPFQHQYVIRAVDVSPLENNNSNNKNQKSFNNNTAFRNALNFAQTRSAELNYTPQTEWRNKLPKKFLF